MTLYKLYCILLLVIGSLLIGGCKKDWLDIKTDKKLAVPSTLQDFQALLDYSLMNTNSISLGEEASDGHYIPEPALLTTTSDKTRNAYTWSHDRPYAFPGMADWTGTYSKIYQANVVLDGLKRIKSTTDEEQIIWNDIKGQAFYHRAERFFLAAQVWAPPYVQQSAATDLGIPLKLESDVNLPTIRSSVLQTYDQIINDLTAAQDLLPNTIEFGTRPSKAAAYALLARTYLIMRNYAKAGEFAQKALDLKSELMDYNNLPANSNFIRDFRTNPEVILHMQMLLGSFFRSNYFVDQDMYDSYSDNDLRKTFFFRKNTNSTISFKGNYLNSNRELFCGPATDEMYLIRAESYARTGNKDSAMKDLNILLKKRWNKSVAFPTFTATNADDALEQILMERNKELLLRGLRWSDLRRLNKEDRFKITITRVIGGVTYTLEPNSYKYTFPIPDDIVAISGIKQNLGW